MFSDMILKLIWYAVAASVFVSGLAMWVFREYISARVKSSIQHEYDLKLEAHKAEIKKEQDFAILNIQTVLAREAAFHAAAHASFAEGQKASMERKLNAVDRLWSCIPQFRESLPPVQRIIDHMTVDEYKGAKDNPIFLPLLDDLSPERLAKLTPKAIEEVRPYVGEHLWTMFFCYQAIMIRIFVLLQFGQTDAEKLEWHKDTGTRHLIETVLVPGELAQFDQTQFGKLSWLQQRLEWKMLAATQKIISGETFGSDSLEQTRLIQQRIAQLAAKPMTS